MKNLVITCICLLITAFSSAQTSSYPKDVTSVDAIMEAIYDVISGSEETPRDWERFRYLFAPDAKLIPTRKQPDGKVIYQYWSPEDYVKMFTENRTSFYEKELHRVTEAYGNIVHVFSTYETRSEVDGQAVNRGINSFQLLKGKDRYFIMNIFWSAESDGYKLPDRYLD